MALHAMSRFDEALAALACAERLDPRNPQVLQAIQMAAYKKRSGGGV